MTHNIDVFRTNFIKWMWPLSWVLLVLCFASSTHAQELEEQRLDSPHRLELAGDAEEQEDEEEAESELEESWSHNLKYDERSRTNYNLDSRSISLYTELVNYKQNSQISAKSLDSMSSNLTARLDSRTELQLGLDIFNEREENLMYWNTAIKLRHNFISTPSGFSFGVMPQLSLPPRGDVNSEQMRPGISLPFDIYLSNGFMAGIKTVVEKAKDWDYDRWKTNYITSAYIGHRIYEDLSVYLEYNDERSDEKSQTPFSTMSLSLTKQVMDVVQLQIATNLDKGEDYSSLEHTFGISVLY